MIYGGRREMRYVSYVLVREVFCRNLILGNLFRSHDIVSRAFSLSNRRIVKAFHEFSRNSK